MTQRKIKPSAKEGTVSRARINEAVKSMDSNPAEGYKTVWERITEEECLDRFRQSVGLEMLLACEAYPGSAWITDEVILDYPYLKLQIVKRHRGLKLVRVRKDIHPYSTAIEMLFRDFPGADLEGQAVTHYYGEHPKYVTYEEHLANSAANAKDRWGKVCPNSLVKALRMVA